MASEDILMAGVQAGGDRQDLHERIRRHSQAAASEVKDHGRPNDLLKRLAGDPAFDEFMRNLEALLEPLLPRYESEGKSYLTVAVGCTGGRHRSVFVAERIAAWLGDLGLSPKLAHRDLEKAAN